MEGLQLLSEVLGPLGREVTGLSNDLWYFLPLFCFQVCNGFLVPVSHGNQ